MAPEIVNIDDISRILKVSKSKIYHDWPGWRDRGVRILKLKPNDRPRFYLSDILKMMESAK